MHDVTFYNVGCDDSRGLRRVVVLARRLLRRVLRPIFVRQVELFELILNRLEQNEQTSQVLSQRLDQHEEAHQVLRQQIDHIDAQAQAALASRFDQHEQALQVLRLRLDHADAQMRATLALGWDHVALVRRLANIEDRVEALMAECEERESRADAEASVSCAKVA